MERKILNPILDTVPAWLCFFVPVGLLAWSSWFLPQMLIQEFSAGSEAITSEEIAFIAVASVFSFVGTLFLTAILNQTRFKVEREKGWPTENSDYYRNWIREIFSLIGGIVADTLRVLGVRSKIDAFC